MTDAFAFFRRFSRSLGQGIDGLAAAQPRTWFVFVVLVAVMLSLFSRFPVYADRHAKFPGSFLKFPGTPYGQAITWWLDHPFQQVPVETFFPNAAAAQGILAGSISHCDKLSVRPFLPLLNQLAGGGYWTLVGASHLSAILLFALIYFLCRRITGDTTFATLITWGFATTWAGAWGFNDRVCGDVVAIALLLSAVAARPPWLAALLVYLAGFTDERAIAAAPLAALLRHWIAGLPGDTKAGPAKLTATVLPLLAAMGAYLASRVVLHFWGNVQGGTTMMVPTEVLLYHFYVSYPKNLFTVFEFLWLFPLVFVGHLIFARDPRITGGVPYLIALALAAGPAFVVWDIDRSLCYLLPGLLTAICFFPAERDLRRGCALAAALASLAWMEPNTSILRFLFL
ncbi:MAG: hypothetical protein JNG83_09335 [Opitutaceae bacterium]|nr:hypothetical protein [Opitutaceae bacterium]